MPKPDVDPKRTVKAFYREESDDWYSEPGGVSRKSGSENFPHTLIFACPGCGSNGSIPCKPGPKEERSWQITAGSLADVTTLTLAPSIHCVGCCGWHGFLKNGTFESC